MPGILELLDIVPSHQSGDYVRHKGQFHLHNLLTEQRHPRTWNLSYAIAEDTEAGLGMLLSVDEDVARKVGELARTPESLEQAVEAVVSAVLSGHRIYFYGCGATGRLAKQMESTFWRPFWRKMRASKHWQYLQGSLPEDIEERLVGEMTGADRALVSSLEGFEDLQLIGRLQLEDHGVRKGDVVVCVTEGGETSSVIGTVRAALAQHGGAAVDDPAAVRRKLYFVYNNPDEVLRPFERSRVVLEEPAITKINLTTGPQAITGSTRLQATTIETFVLGIVLEAAVIRLLSRFLPASGLAEIGCEDNRPFSARLGDFFRIKEAVDRARGDLARLTDLEAAVYRRGGRATYYAEAALITVFIDNTERSPTFRLHPLDRVDAPERRCWVQVWTRAGGAGDAWRTFLGRPFRGLEEARYKARFQTDIEDPYLKEAALKSLRNAGTDQERFYDFSFARFNTEHRSPAAGDLGVTVMVDDEVRELAEPSRSFSRFVRLVQNCGAAPAVLWVGRRESLPEDSSIGKSPGESGVVVRAFLDDTPDPLGVRRQIALKMMLNAHSTGLMAALGRVVANTMTSVSPSNLKLVGRATHLIMTHVNDVLKNAAWAPQSAVQNIGFEEANAVLFEAMDWVREMEVGETAEVALSIIRIAEAARRRSSVDWQEAKRILEKEGLADYLARNNPVLKAGEGSPTQDSRDLRGD